MAPLTDSLIEEGYSATHEMRIKGHKLVALSFNADLSGTPIILLHGITSSVKSWVPEALPFFAGYGPCYALSLPGHYPAAFPLDFRQESLTAEMIAQVLTAAIHKLVGKQPVILVGHSTGGFAALAIAAYTPEIARCVISISGFAQGRWIGILGAYQRLARRGFLGKSIFKLTYRANRWPRAWFRASLRVYAADPRRLFAYPYLDTIVDNSLPYYRQLDLDAMVQYFAVMPDIDIGYWLPRITAPTLVLTGENDPIVPPAQSHLIAGKVSYASLEVIKGVGHMLMFEDHIEYQRIVGEWLQRQC
jgi:pimeloyl-ACP methyl ester carboxylesterase